MSDLLLQIPPVSEIAGRCFHPLLDRDPLLHFPAVLANFQSAAENRCRRNDVHSHGAVVALTAVVSDPSPLVSGPLPPFPTHSRPPIQGEWSYSSPQPSTAQADSVVSQVLFSPSFPPHISAILLESRRPSTRRSYERKWACFCCYATTKDWPLSQIRLVHVFDFIVHLKDSGMGFSSLKVFLAALSANLSRIDSYSVFSHPSSKSFLKGLLRVVPPRRPFIPDWNLSLVLAQLMLSPFEPMASTELRLLTWKTVFLEPITSARCCSELSALMAFFIRIRSFCGQILFLCLKLFLFSTFPNLLFFRYFACPCLTPGNTLYILSMFVVLYPFTWLVHLISVSTLTFLSHMACTLGVERSLHSALLAGSRA